MFEDCTFLGVISEHITGLYNFRCNVRENYKTEQRCVLYLEKLQDCTTFGVISEQITGLYNIRFYVRTN